MRLSVLRSIAILFVLLFSTNLFSETLVVMEINDRTGKIHPEVIKGSKEYVIQLLTRVGKYKVIPDGQVMNARKRSKIWKNCNSMECQVEIGKAFKADIIVVPSVDYFAGIYTLTINYVYVEGKRKTEAGAIDFNGTAVGMKKAVEAVISTIHGKKIAPPKVTAASNKQFKKYSVENFKKKKAKEYVVPNEPSLIPIPKKIVYGKVKFSSVQKGIKATIDGGTSKAVSCKTPCSIKSLTVGTHSVRYELDGHITKDETLNVKGNSTLTKKVSLIPIIQRKEEINNQLIQAAKEGKLRLVKSLLNKGANVNYHDKTGLSPYIIAALSGNKELAGYLKGRGARFTSVEVGTLMMVAVEKDDKWLAGLIKKNKTNLNLTYDNGQTILWYAANKKSWKVFDVFAKSGVNINHKDNSGQTIFTWALNNGYTQVVDRLGKAGVKTSKTDLSKMMRQAVSTEDYDKIVSLLKMKPNLNKKYEDGLTLLWYSAVKKRTDIASLLLKSGSTAKVRDKSGRSLLMYCIETRRFEMARLLRRYGGSLKNSEGILLLQKGLVIGDSDLIQLLVELNVNVNMKFSDGLSALWIAAFTNNREMVEVIADAGANLNIKDKNGRTVLMWCVENNRKDVATILIRKGANVNLMDKKNRTALINAVVSDKPRMVHMLVKNGAKVNLKDKEGNSPLLISVARGNLSLVKLFLNNGAAINTSDVNGNTPLNIALYKNYEDIVTFLLDKNADINKANKKGESPLIIASRKGNLRLVKMFLTKGADIDHADKGGTTALIHAKRENRRRVVMHLLNNGATLDKRKEKDEMMAYGTLNSYHDVVQNLIGRNVSVNRRFPDGLFPLYYATRNGDNKMMDMLINAGADLEARDRNSMTVLLYAASKREEHVVVTLVQKGANVSVTDKQKNTPLIISAGRGFAQAVKAMISKGANVNAKDSKGRTALVRAKWTGNYQIVDILKKAGAFE